MDRGVQGLHAAVEHLRRTGHVLDRGDRQPRLQEDPGGAAGGHELDAETDERAGEVRQPGLVVGSEDRAPDRPGPRHDVPADPHGTTLHHQPPFEQGTDGARQESVLQLVDPGLERVPGVVRADLERLLEDHGPRVGPLIDQVDRHTGHLHAVRERVAHPVHAGERRQQGGMDVEPTPLVGARHRRAEQPHVAGAHQQVDPAALEFLQHGSVEGPAIGERVGLDHGGGDAGRRRSFEGTHTRTIGQHEGDARADGGVVQERLKVRSRSGDQHRDASAHRGGHRGGHRTRAAGAGAGHGKLGVPMRRRPT